MRFPVVIHKDKDSDSESDYGVTVPDLPGCFSAGNTFDDALINAEEAIECHVEGMLIDGEQIPSNKSVEVYKRKKEYRGGVWALVSIDLSKLSGKAKRINITLPERLLHQVDQYATSHGESRSGLIANAALEYISSHD